MIQTADPAFVDGELRLALYYAGLRDKIAALNVAVVGFSFPVYKQIETLKAEFFAFLLVLGFLSFVAAIRTSIAYNYHFRNYENYLQGTLSYPVDAKELFTENRAKYANEKGAFSLLTFGFTYLPTHVFWAVAIGMIAPAVAIFVYHPW